MLSARRLATLRRFCDALLVALIAVVLFGVVLGRVVPLAGRTTLIVGGGSMEPALPLGSAVIEDRVPPSDLGIGNIISLRTGSRLQSIFTHRVTRIVPREGVIWVETKGDANAAADPSLTSSEHVIGRVSVVIPYAGFLLALLSVPSGVLFAVLLAGVLLTLTWLLESLEIELAIREAGRRVDAPHIARRAAGATRLRRARRASDPLAGGR